VINNLIHRLTVYWKSGRNLNHPRGMDSRHQLLKRGKLNVVAFLADLPPTRHDPQSFAVDLTVFTVSFSLGFRRSVLIKILHFQPQMIVLTVTGLFKERNPNAEYARTFQKTMVIVPNNAGFCIINEMFHINNASASQARNAFKAPVVAAPQMSAAISSPQQPLGGAPDEATKMQMIQAMSQQSNMNFEWSRKCLEETNWDFARAGFVFSELFKQSKIPPEAFVK
jgi:nuclear RNA export factor